MSYSLDLNEQYRLGMQEPDEGFLLTDCCGLEPELESGDGWAAYVCPGCETVVEEWFDDDEPAGYDPSGGVLPF